MRFQLGPRDPRAAARTASWIYIVSSVVVFVSNLLIPTTTDSRARFLALAVPFPLLIIGGLLAWPGFRYRQLFLLLTPLFGVGIVLFLDLATRDATAGAQVAFCLPVLFAASQLRFLGAGVTVVAAVAGDALIVWQLKPNGAGMLDLVDVSLVLLLMTGLLVQAGRRQDRLVALLESRASLDPLTGLVTRRVLDEAVLQALSSPEVGAGTALILVDVDHFKSINDTYGHPVGDDALVHLARVLGRQSRPDTVISRLGGDEVAVLLPGCPLDVAEERAYDFLQAMQADPMTLPGGGSLVISISLGVAHVPTGGRPLRELYAAADASLYEAKRAGRGRVGRPVRSLGGSVGAGPTWAGPVGYPGLASPVVGAQGAGSQGVADGALEV